MSESSLKKRLTVCKFQVAQVFLDFLTVLPFTSFKSPRPQLFQLPLPPFRLHSSSQSLSYFLLDRVFN